MEINSRIEFFKIVSQIIPILFLSVSIQSVFIARREQYKRLETFQRNLHIMLFTAMVLVLFMGEFVSLRDVYNGSIMPNDIIIVTLSLFLGVLWVVQDFILYLLGRSKEVYFVGFMIFGALLEYLILSRF